MNAPALWFATLGHCGSGFLMRVLRNVGLLRRTDPDELASLAEFNRRVLEAVVRVPRGLWRSTDTVLQPWTWPEGLGLPFGKDPPRVVKDPTWSVTLPAWLDNGRWPPACLMLLRDPREFPWAKGYRGDVEGDAGTVLLSAWARTAILLDCARRLGARQVPGLALWYPGCFEDPRQRALLARWLAHVLGGSSGLEIEAAVVALWNPDLPTRRKDPIR